MIDAAHLEAFDETLRSGRYSLLLGSGISLSSTNVNGQKMLSAEALRVKLCKQQGLNQGRSLAKAVSSLRGQDIHENITLPYTCKEPSGRLADLTKFLWQRIYTFNVDDVVECVYAKHSHEVKQELKSIHFSDPYEPSQSLDDLAVVHLHGSVRDESRGYVFTYTDYAEVMQKINPWMTILGDTIATEPFIVSGTSLAEPDFEYYLSHRTRATPKIGVGPSLLIDPDPDASTQGDCNRHGLLLVKGTFEEFLEWLATRHPNMPSVSQLVVPDVASVFAGADGRSQVRFYSNFEAVSPTKSKLKPIASAFFYGHPPSDDDLSRHSDITRSEIVKITTKLRDWERRNKPESQITVVYGEPGSGKTTLLRRLAHDMAMGGSMVMRLRSLGRLDVSAATACLGTATRPVFLVVDSLADHAEQVQELIDKVPDRIHVVSADRVYRKRHNETVANLDVQVTYGIGRLSISEQRQLIERMRHLGLVADSTAISNPDQLAAELRLEPVAVAVCRIMRDFAPLRRIVESLWNEASETARDIYLVAAIAYFCYQNGVQQTLLQRVAGRSFPIASMMGEDSPLRLAISEVGRGYLVPMNGTIGERMVTFLAEDQIERLEAASLALARALAPYVNRTAIMRRTPEARLVGRLFDADVFVRPFLKDRAEEWYVACQSDWEWNSRYWEQRAILASAYDINKGVAFAKMALAIEEHPFTLNTLSSILFKQIERGGVAQVQEIFDEAFYCVRRAIAFEKRKSRVSVYPYMTLCSGVVAYVRRGGELNGNQRDEIAALATSARQQFAKDRSLMQQTQDVLDYIGR